jgi:cell wall-associated NlpC family hydrolase
MKTLSYSLWGDLLGKPFAPGARGPAAFDCVGCFVELQHRLGVPIPAWGSHVRLLDLAKLQWEQIASYDTQPGDAILLHSTNPPWHLGVVCGNGEMIHASEDAGAVVKERYNTFPWQNKVEGFYRWKAEKTTPAP